VIPMSLIGGRLREEQLFHVEVEPVGDGSSLTRRERTRGEDVEEPGYEVCR